MEKKEDIKEIFQLKVTLKDSDPPIWRRFLVWDDISFESLHSILQDVMGWDGYHPYEFVVKGERIVNPDGAKPSLFHDVMTSTEDVCLNERLRRVGQKFEYIYDFGDNWEHEIVFEKRLPFDENQPLPFCLEGELACPPEDIGGIFGFYNLMERINTPQDDEESFDEDTMELRDWLGNFDPNFFDVNAVNKNLRPRKYNGEFDEEIVRDHLEFIFESQSLDTCLRELEIHVTAENREKLMGLVFSSDKHVLDIERDKIYPGYYFLKQFKTMIQPSPMEIERGILFPGNCLIPYFNVNFNVNGLNLQDHSQEMEIREMTFKWKEVEGFFSLVNAENMPMENPPVSMEPDQEITVFAVDLKKFYQRTHFKTGDSIVVEPEDLYNHSFSLKFVSAEKMKKKSEKIQQSNHLFLEHLRKVLKMNIPFLSISHQILYALYGIFIMDFRTWDVPGAAFDKFICNADEITISTLENGRKLLRLK